MELLRKSVQGIATVIGALSHDESPYTRAEVIILEEQERQRRLDHPSQAVVSKKNAANISALIKNTKNPYFKSSSKGYKRVTRKLEEVERKRRTDNKVECSLRQFAALRSSVCIKSLGWPFYLYDLHNGAEYIFPSQTMMAEEEERKRRMNTPAWALTAKNNASLVSNFVRWDNFRAPVANHGYKRYTRSLEERERTRRLKDMQGSLVGVQNASRVSHIIAQLGWPFFVGQPAEHHEEDYMFTKDIEEKERKRRLINPAEEQLAREHAQDVSQIIVHTPQKSFAKITESPQIQQPLSAVVEDDRVLEETERSRRISDRVGESQASRNAKKLASIVSVLKKPILKHRKSVSKSAELKKSASKPADEFIPQDVLGRVPDFDPATRTDDDFIPQDVLGRESDYVPSEEIIAVVEDVTIPLATMQTVVITEIAPAVNIQAHSSLVRTQAIESVLTEPTTVFAEPVTTTYTESIATYSPSTVYTPTTTTITYTSTTPITYGRPATLNTPISVNARSALTGLPEKPISPTAIPSVPADKSIANTPTQSHATQYYAPPQSTYSSPAIYPLKSATAVPAYSPVTKILPRAVSLPASTFSLESGLNSLPSSIPGTPSVSGRTSPVLPEDFRPMSPTFTPETPIIQGAPMFKPISLEPVLASATLATPNMAPRVLVKAASTSYVPAETSTFSNVRVHRFSEKERKKLEKQAVKHSKLATKEAKKAETQISKAQKMLSKGKEDRAKKFESKAEQHNIASRNHRQWATDLATDAVAPSLAYNAQGRPVM